MGCIRSKQERKDNPKEWQPTDIHNHKQEDKPAYEVPRLLDDIPSQPHRYLKTDIGTFEIYLDYRQHREPVEYVPRPRVEYDQYYTDSTFQLDDAITKRSDQDYLPLQWKRPIKFAPSPVLFSHGTRRFDIEQGMPGTCWFLSMVANISEKPDLLQRVITKDSYRINTTVYDGIFHCKFWQFGQWHDVYIDDYLSVYSDNVLWGAKSNDKNEMWVPLLEKAFASFHGSYNNVDGGHPCDAYMAMTGGVSEAIELNEYRMEPIQLFRRVRNAILSGSLVTCGVPTESDQKVGLVGGHAYSLNATRVVKTRVGEKFMLLRVRNPWGRTEWDGDWSDRSPKWKDLELDSWTPIEKDDGEFWISIDDLMTYFFQLTICSLTPDFNLDGWTDNLNYITCIYGEWIGETAAGCRNKTDNPGFVFTLTRNERTTGRTVPIVIQLIQKTEDGNTDIAYINMFLYQIREGHAYLMQPEDKINFINTIQISHRYQLKHRQYTVIPSTYDPRKEKQFLIRIFSSAPLQDVRRRR